MKFSVSERAGNLKFHEISIHACKSLIMSSSWLELCMYNALLSSQRLFSMKRDRARNEDFMKFHEDFMKSCEISTRCGGTEISEP